MPETDWVAEADDDAQVPVDQVVEDSADAEADHLHRAPKYNIDSYGADYPVDAFVKRLESGDMRIPVYQRDFVWTKGQSSRFVESLLLGLPVPAVFLAKDASDNRMLIVDGQQRLLSLEAFYAGK